MTETGGGEQSTYAGFWWRVLAFFIDGFALGVAASVLAAAIGLFVDGAVEGPSRFAAFVAQWVYFAGFESSQYRATPGKMVCRLVVVDSHGRRVSFTRASVRYFAKLLSAVLLFIGYLMIAFTERKQGLHDLIADTLVLRLQARPVQ